MSKVRVICQVCGKELWRVPSAIYGGVFCSRACRAVFQTKDRVIRICETCGKEFEYLPGRKNKGRYCSNHCFFTRSKNTKLCLACGQKFYTPPGVDGKYCSRDCFQKGRRKTICCPVCNKEFTVPRSSEQKYCSMECSRKRLREKQLPHIVVCALCGKEFQGSKTRKYCCRECSWEAQREWTEYTCLNCGMAFRRTASWEGAGKYCSMECAHEHNRGENHVNWKDGSSKDKYPPAFNKALRYKVRERDGFKCRICDCAEGDIPHDVHHKDGDKENNVLENLILLCGDCHQGRVHNGEGLDFWLDRVYQNAT